MIEVFRKGFRLDIDPSQVVTFKKAQNLNGIQSRYGYSNDIKGDLTANNRKLLELPELPTGKLNTLQNGFTVDVVLNGSIQLRNQTLNVRKENKTNVDLYLLYSDNALVVKLKEQYVNSIVSDFKYKKTLSDFATYPNTDISRVAFVETQEKSGLFVIEEMPVLISLQEIIRRLFTSNGYTVYGDFFEVGNEISKYYVAPNQGIYQIYSGTGEGFAPNFDPTLDLFKFLSDTLQLANSYADVDDTYRTVIVNQWTNLGNYKNDYVDYSKYYLDYQDYSFQSKLAKRNEMTYSDSGTTFNSFFSNNLSSQDKTTYLASQFGTGPLNIFDDSDVEEDGTIGVRANGALGETSAVRIFKISEQLFALPLYSGGVASGFTARKAIPISMRDIYTFFHKDYIDFILTPLVQNIIFKYDEILAATFSLTKVFFVDKIASYWIPLEINFTTKKDSIVIKAMLVKKRKVVSPILNNFDSVLLDFKEKALFPLENLLSMYPMPPNEYPWDVVIFKSYNQTKNRLYINDVLVPANSLPQAFAIADISTIKFEANQPSDTTPDTATDSLYLQAQDTNGGISNEAYITIKHTGVASLQSDFVQQEIYHYERFNFDNGQEWVNLLSYVVGPSPNLNTTITSVAPTQNSSGPDDDFNLVEITEDYPATKIVTGPINVYLKTESNGNGKARATIQLIIFDGTNYIQKYEIGSADNQEQNLIIPSQVVNIPALPIGKKIRAYLHFAFDNRRGSNSGSMDVIIDIANMTASIATTKTVI
jgi:hypothetical protein